MIVIIKVNFCKKVFFGVINLIYDVWSKVFVCCFHFNLKSCVLFFFFLNILYFHVINYSFHLVFSFYEFHYLLLKSNFLSNLSKKFSLIFILKFIFSIAKELGSWSLTLSLTLCFCRVSWDLDYNHLSIYLSIYLYIYIYIFFMSFIQTELIYIYYLSVSVSITIYSDIYVEIDR